MSEYRTKIQDGGRLVIPAECRRALHMEPGEEVILRVREDELLIYPSRQALKRARQLVKKYIPKKKKLVDELITERRREAAHE
jgi:AbrB family looped-hinge helix DNA binding protein